MLVEALLEHDALPLLVHRLSTFDEKVPAEAAAVYNILAILENMTEVKPEVAEQALEKTKVGGGAGAGDHLLLATRAAHSKMCPGGVAASLHGFGCCDLLQREAWLTICTGRAAPPSTLRLQPPLPPRRTPIPSHPAAPPAAAQVAAGAAAAPRSRQQQAIRVGDPGHPGAAVGWAAPPQLWLAPAPCRSHQAPQGRGVAGGKTGGRAAPRPHHAPP